MKKKVLAYGGTGVLAAGFYLWGAQGFTLPNLAIVLVGLALLGAGIVVHLKVE